MNYHTNLFQIFQVSCRHHQLRFLNTQQIEYARKHNNKEDFTM